MRNSIALFVLFCMCSNWHAQAQGDANSTYPDQRLMHLWSQDQSANDSLLFWQERIHLQLDKTAVSREDHVFFKANILTGPKQLRVSASKVLKVELLDQTGKLIKSQFHEIIDGATQGEMAIPKELAEGSYFFRAYTHWMQNYGPEIFALEKLQIGDFNHGNENSIVFYPEGGNLIAALPNRLVIRTEANSLIGDQIVDGQGNLIAQVVKYDAGLATCLFSPEVGKDYFLNTTEGILKKLPEIQPEGFLLRVNNIESSTFEVAIRASQNLFKERLWLRGFGNGQVYFEKPVSFESGAEVKMEIPKTALPNGIISLKLVDEFEQLWAERPVLISNNELKIEVLPYSGGSVTQQYHIRVSNLLGEPVQTALSLGVSEVDPESATDKLVLENNARGLHFFQDLQVLAEQHSGQRPKLNRGEIPDKINYGFQEHLDFIGQAYDLNSNLLTNTDIQVLINTENDVSVYEVQTDESGMFSLGDIRINGTAKMVFRTRGEATEEKLVRVIPYDFETPPLSEAKATVKNKQESKVNYANASNDFGNLTDQDRLIPLEEVTLTEKKPEKKKERSVYGIKAAWNRVIRQDPKRPRMFSELFNELPGLFTGGGGNYPSARMMSGGATSGGLTGGGGLSILDQNGPLWIVDGMNYGNSTRLDPSWGLVALDIDRIELIPPFSPDASMWGSRANQGIILIYTRDGSDDSFIDRKEGQLTYKGFHKSIDFEAYKKDRELDSKTFNRVIYWNPKIQTDKNGEAIIHIDANSKAEKLKFKATAFTEKGEYGTTEQIF